MAGIFETEADKYLGHLLRGETHAGYATVYFALLSSAPTKDMDGSDVAAIEVDYTSYARVAVTVGTAAFDDPANGASENSASITFPTSTGGSSTATHWAMLDGNAGDDNDDPILFGGLSDSLTISSGVTPRFATGDVDFVLY